MKLEPRHYTFLGLLVVVFGSMLLGIRPEVSISEETRRMHAYIDSLPEGSTLIYSFDHESSSLPEIRPAALALLRHSFSKGHRIVGLALLAEGTGIGYRLMDMVAHEQNKQYGSDWVYLGFKPQYIAAILSMGESLQKTFPQDYLGHPYDSLALLSGIINYSQVNAVVSIGDGNMAVHWIEYGQSRFGVTITSAMTAAMVTTYDPYISSGQLHALIGGLRGAAEYETLSGQSGGGLRGMLAQASAHVYVLLLILAGNVIYFIARRRGA
ncbi:MAG: hypothetical protein IPH75_04860 [bacterium]|nr:hypothetical protein [bacterium]